MRIAVAGGTGTVGRRVGAAARAAGHDVVVLSRATGTDLRTATGLASALLGCDAVIDITGTNTLGARTSVRFFTAVTENLLRAGREAGVPHHVALSIVGAAQTDAGYYAGKAAQERLVMADGDRWSVLRTTQFHEFAAQTATRGALLGMHLVPRMPCQPVAAAEVATALVDVVAAGPSGLVPDLAGPRVERLADLVRAYLRATAAAGPVVEVRLPGRFGRALATGGALPGATARIGHQPFADWIQTLDD